MKRFTLLIVLITVFLAVTLVSSAQDDSIHCDAPDFSQVQSMAAEADAAMMSGDLVTAIQLRAESAQLYRQIQNACILMPLAETLGLDETMVEAIAAMPTCQYRFDATVRSGDNEGVSLHGTLSLMQNSATTAVGYVYTLTMSEPVPVMAEFGEGREITLTFMLSDDSTIIGTGLAETNVATCFGTIEGGFTGPSANDAGDWLGSASQCLNSALPCLPDDVIPKPLSPLGGGICEVNYQPVCMLVCNNGSCHLECQTAIGNACNGD